MIGNNACGSRALGYGRTVGQRRGAQGRLRHRRGRGTAAAVRWPTGWRRWATTTWRTSAPSSAGSPGRSAATRSSTCCPSGRRLDRFLVGSEGTLAVVLEATVRLVAEETGRLLVVLGYPSMAEAADAVPGAAGGGWRPADRVRGARRPDRRPGEGQGSGRAGAARRAPAGCSSEVAGEDAPALAEKVVAASAALGHRTVTDVAEQAALWRIREDGAGPRGAQPPHPGVLRLGGRRGPARAPRCLAARLRRAAARARPRRRALRPLRRRLRARPDRLPVRAR